VSAPGIVYDRDQVGGARARKEANTIGRQAIHPTAGLILRLQQTGGNRAVNQLLRQYANRQAGSMTQMAAPLQRCGATPCNCSADEKAAHEAVHQESASPVARVHESGENGPGATLGPENGLSALAVQRAYIGGVTHVQRDMDDDDQTAQTDQSQQSQPADQSQPDQSSPSPNLPATDSSDPGQSYTDMSQSNPNPSPSSTGPNLSSSDPGQAYTDSSSTTADTSADGDPVPTTGTTCGASSTTINPVPKTKQVSGKTLNEVYQNNFATGAEAGSVQPVFNPSPPTYCPSDQGAKVQSAVVNIDEIKTMPSWTEYSQQCAAVKAEWDRWYAAVDKHENGHIAIDKQYFTNVHTKLVGKTDPDTALNTVVTNADTANQTYDANQANFAGMTIDAGIGCP
jgi:uncharacterized protein DUF922